MEIRFIRIVDVASGTELRRFDAWRIRGLAFSADGRRLVGWGGMWSTKNGAVYESTAQLRILDAEAGTVEITRKT